jgi:hypothetical protein
MTTEENKTPGIQSGPQPGQVMSDGTVYAGVSPDTGRPLFTTPADLSLKDKWHKAAVDQAARLEAHGHKDWRLPTAAELGVLFNNRAAIGKFDESGAFSSGQYWSSDVRGLYDARIQRFSDGLQHSSLRCHSHSLRCVRG